MECPNDATLFDLNSTTTQNLLAQLVAFRNFYAPIHGVVCVALCVFGILTNLVHVAVLSRPLMRSSAVNCLLTAVAVCDVGTMGTYLVYIVHFVLRRRSTCSPTFTHGWMQFLLWHVVLSITLHTTSLWLAVAMAFVRRMTLRVARLNSKWQRPSFAWRIALVIYVVVFILCVPNMLVHDIEEYTGAMWEPPARCSQSYPRNYTEKIYTFLVSKTATSNNCRMFKANIWMIGIIFKIIPCLLLFFLSIGLMVKLQDAEKNRRKLTSCNSNSSSYKKAKSDRTTAMLIVILIVFLITELPQGIISILCAIYTADVHRYLYFYLGDVLDLLSLLNSSVNFVLYCTMSSRYRKTFWTVVLPEKIYKQFLSRRGTATQNAQSHGGKNSHKSNGRQKDYCLLPTADIISPSPDSRRSTNSARVDHLSLTYYSVVLTQMTYTV